MNVRTMSGASCPGSVPNGYGRRHMGENIEFASNGSTAVGYLATPKKRGEAPESSSSKSGGAWSTTFANVCDRFAAAGFVALAPDPHLDGATIAEPDEAGKAMMALRMDQAARDMSGAVDELVRRSGRAHVGVIGFCMGGGSGAGARNPAARCRRRGRAVLRRHSLARRGARLLGS